MKASYAMKFQFTAYFNVCCWLLSIDFLSLALFFNFVLNSQDDAFFSLKFSSVSYSILEISVSLFKSFRPATALWSHNVTV